MAVPDIVLLGRPNTRIRLPEDGFAVRGRPIARDWFDLPAGRQEPITADRFPGLGDAYDFEFRPT